MRGKSKEKRKVAGEIVFRPELEDNIAVARASFRRGLTKRRFHLRVAIALSIAVLMGAGISYMEQGSVRLVAIAGAVGVMACWLAVALIALYLLIPRRAKRLFRQQRSLAHDFTLSWNSTGLSQRWDKGALHTMWAEYHDWFEDNRTFGFALNEQLYHFAPKRVMNAAQCDDLRATAMAIAAPDKAT